MTFLQALAVQRWDDHRYYHHSRINQSLHLVSALTFLTAYVMVFVNPLVAVMLGWLVAMPTRQAGHFFFEPKGYDEANQATHEYKEDVKVGYNLHRKVVLLTIWALLPVGVIASPTLGGLLQRHTGVYTFAYNVSILWLALSVAALLFRAAQLWYLFDVQTAVVWLTKILTDPFHDVLLYGKSPLYLLRGERFDPIVGNEPPASRATSVA